MQRRIEAFMTLADEEFSAARKLHSALPRQALYFLQQCVEKLIRACLEAAEIPAGTGHNISFLAGLLPEEHALRARFREFEHLSAASTRYRYPSGTGAVYQVPADEATKSLAEVSVLRDEVNKFLHSRAGARR